MTGKVKDPRSLAFGIIALMGIGTGISMYRSTQETQLIRSEGLRISIECQLIAGASKENYQECVEEQEKLSPAFNKEFSRPRLKLF